MKGLVIRSPHIEEILSGRKTWEIRGSATKIRGKIALIKSGSGKIFGTAELSDCIGPLSLEDFARNSRKSRIPKKWCGELPYPKTYAWVLQNAKQYARPKLYDHPQGAVIWVNLD